MKRPPRLCSRWERHRISVAAKCCGWKSYEAEVKCCAKPAVTKVKVAEDNFVAVDEVDRGEQMKGPLV